MSTVQGKGRNIAGKATRPARCRTETTQVWRDGEQGCSTTLIRGDNNVLERRAFSFRPMICVLSKERFCERCGALLEEQCGCIAPERYIWRDVTRDDRQHFVRRALKAIAEIQGVEKVEKERHIEYVDMREQTDTKTGQQVDVAHAIVVSAPLRVLEWLETQPIVARMSLTLDVAARPQGAGAAGQETTERKAFKEQRREMKMSRAMKELERDARYCRSELSDKDALSFDCMSDDPSDCNDKKTGTRPMSSQERRLVERLLENDNPRSTKELFVCECTAVNDKCERICEGKCEHARAVRLYEKARLAAVQVFRDERESGRLHAQFLADSDKDAKLDAIERARVWLLLDERRAKDVQTLLSDIGAREEFTDMTRSLISFANDMRKFGDPQIIASICKLSGANERLVDCAVFLATRCGEGGSHDSDEEKELRRMTLSALRQADFWERVASRGKLIEKKGKKASKPSQPDDSVPSPHARSAQVCPICCNRLVPFSEGGRTGFRCECK